MAQPKVLIVDDEKNIVEAIRYNLEQAGFRTITAHDGRRALELAQRELPDLITLDVMLPEQDGWEVCRLLRQDRRTQHIPVIMLTVKGEEADKVVGLELGADDYMTKPFSPKELVSRVKAILRRSKPSVPSEAVRIGGLDIDFARHLVRIKDKPVELTAKEFELLKALVEANGRVLSRDLLLDRVWGLEQSLEIQTRTVDVHVGQLRKKLKSEAKRLVTVKNAGYRFDIDSD
ncbi:MAG: DNA-binding response regulator [Candidatus Omnitrophica bacterium CG11_big_fil_rev_8_21_14_0_20_63_9]|nr:MAG: DNA-binding response regulator [Candidatus Omnitrophica bacterium CG11_big_fil_rev_8_21_14_0_20_63_9]